MLNLPQMLILLSIDDDKGSILPIVPLRYGLKAAVLADLTLIGKIKIDEQRKLWVIDSTRFGDEILEDELGIICASGQPRKISSWMHALGYKKLRKQISDSLVQNDILIVEKTGFQWVIPFSATPEYQASAKYWVKKQLREIVLASETPEPRLLALLVVLRDCRLLNLIFTSIRWSLRGYS